MSWGLELWDQFENISQHTQKGIDFCEKFSHYVKERCAIENDYATKLKRLAKSYQPKPERADKKKEVEFTCMKGFYAMVKELNDLAGQHEAIAENLNTTVFKELQTTVTETKQERKRLLQEAAKQQGLLQNQIAQLDKAKKQYERMFREAEKAQDLYRKAEQDIHLSRAELEKAKLNMNNKQQTCEESKGEYAMEVGKTNQAQRDHYETQMPQIFQQLQDMDEKRVTKVQSLIASSADIENKVMPIISTCIEGMAQAATIVDCKQDSQIVIDQFKTGFVPPGEIQFEDLSNGGLSAGTSLPKLEASGKVTVSASKNKKRSGIRGIFGAAKSEEPREDFGHLPPNQQRKQLQNKIDSLKANLSKDTSARDALLKMQDVYRQTPSLGDPASVDRQLEENAQKLDQLRQEIAKFENFMADMDKNGSLEVGGVTPTPSPCQSRHAAQPPPSSVSVQPKVEVSNAQPPPVTDQTVTEQVSFDDADDEFNDANEGTCVAVYSFEATTDSALSMTEGEEFTIIESDQGDGWTHVRRGNGESGFVPTSYVKCQFN